MERRKCTYTLFRYLLYLCLSDGFVFLYCRGWIYSNGVRNPNSILGVLVRENFPGLVQLPGPDEVPQPGLKWEHFVLPRPRRIRPSTGSNATPEPTWSSTAFG